MCHVKILVSLKDETTVCSSDACMRKHRPATCPLSQDTYSASVLEFFKNWISFVPFAILAWNLSAIPCHPCFHDPEQVHIISKVTLFALHTLFQTIYSTANIPESFLHLCEYPILSPLPFSGTLNFKLISLSKGFKEPFTRVNHVNCISLLSCPVILLEKPGLRNLQVWNSLDLSQSCIHLPNCPNTETVLSN